MDQVIAALWGVLAAFLTALAGALVPLARQWAEAQAQRALATVQQRIGEAAARQAAVIAMEVATNPDLSAASREAVELLAGDLRARFADTARKYALPPGTFTTILTGELAKAGVRVKP